MKIPDNISKEIYSDSPVPAVSAIIITLGSPKREESVRGLIKALKTQSHPPGEIIIVRNVKPGGKARNAGSDFADGEYLLFLDDDAMFVSNHIIALFVNAFKLNSDAGIVGSATLPPRNLTWFERQYFREFPRGKFLPEKEIVESDMATTLCCMIRKELFIEAGKFDERLVASQDPELRDRIRHRGYKILVVRDAQVIHPPPSNIEELWMRSLRYGVGDATARILFRDEDWRDFHYRRPVWWGLFRLMFWWIGFLINIDKLTQGRWPFSLQLLRPIATLGHGIGYIKGLSKIKSIN